MFKLQAVTPRRSCSAVTARCYIGKACFKTVVGLSWRTLCDINSCTCKFVARFVSGIVVWCVSGKKRSINPKALVKNECSDIQLMFMMNPVEINSAERAALSVVFASSAALCGLLLELHFVSSEHFLHGSICNTQCMSPTSP